ncbi:MAG: histidine--tRNA ligase [Gammaproteobacteria bacterium]|jgi:histidyl-tRNA synthetase|nr:histidine--tRNA ligase [Gammaproteobacteria bacterium]
MHDILPADMPVWNQLEDEYRALAESYGYREIRTPVVEKTALFARSIGAVTDIVEKEMYSFEDRNGDSLSLRPENTASVVRAGLQAGMLQDQQHRLWYSGPMFRHERPQKGRYRQFHQLGAETFGIPGADIEAELILLAARFWKRLGLEDIELQINSLGSSGCRQRFRGILVEYFRDHYDSLDVDSQRRLETNPLRILDSKNPDMQGLIEAAPALVDSLDQESREHFNELTDILDKTGVVYQVNQRLVRGLDYYCHTVFEWVTDTLGAQGTVCGGGRYDGLVEQLGGKPSYAAGFSMGCERLVSMLIDQGRAQDESGCDVYLLMRGENSVPRAQQLAETLRDELPRLGLVVHAGGGSFKSQMRKADKSGARIALILGEAEIAANTVSVKFLRQDRQQEEIPQADIVNRINSLLGNN